MPKPEEAKQCESRGEHGSGDTHYSNSQNQGRRVTEDGIGEGWRVLHQYRLQWLSGIGVPSPVQVTLCRAAPTHSSIEC